MCAMTEDLYERYKEALRGGHVAVLRGGLEEALRMYALAAEIAPSRALPHTSLGGVYMRLSRLDDALVEYAAAVARAPHDEGALLGQADALATAGKPRDAAIALDHVAEIQGASARLPEAADTLRRALELEEAPERVHRQRALLREIRMSAGDRAAEQLLARALRLRDDEPVGQRGSSRTERPAIAAAVAAPAEPAVEEAVAEPAAALMPESDAVEDALKLEAAPEPVAAAKSEPYVEAEPQLEPAVSAESDGYTASEPEPEPELEPELAAMVGLEVSLEDASAPVLAEAAIETSEARGEELEFAPQAAAIEPAWQLAEPPAVGVMAGVDEPASDSSTDSATPQPSSDELLAAAEAAEEAGDDSSLRSLLLWTARAYAREGRFEAGLDTAHRLLMRWPSDVDAHLVLVELYVARSWDALAAEKLFLLGRLAELDGDDVTRRRLCQAASRAFPGNERLGALCA
jgi:tetratricopeptide (TPR) repeat protein